MLLGRFLLGVAEAGFTPAVYYLFSKWFIRAYRPLVLVIYSALLGVSSVLGPTLAGFLVEGGDNLDIASFPGWRFLLLILGIFALIAAIPARLFIVESPAEAPWLTSLEKDRYQAILDADAERANVPSVSSWQVIRDWRPWVMGIGFFSMFYATYTITVWAPTIVFGFQQQFDTHFTTLQASLIAGIPMLFGVLCAFAAALLAGRTGRSAPLAAAAALIGAAGCVSTTFATGPFSTIASLSMVALAGQVGANLFIPIVTRVFAGSGAYAAIALVNSMGAFAGFVSPTVTGWLADLTSNQNSGFYVMSIVLVIGAGITVFTEQRAREVERSRIR
ncbi:major Facilitator Superfamily protein [Ochrobactrum quorumnocens]|uniref:Major Facilitator Superfamily protein n=2 Tax=Ochrobactrum quorumnocens TaxID=271865 RepID=A0A248UDZ8_9HYPH|nr:major Facilitator Superfamily protein [[Ochrobactrum] quorumnocens]